MRKLHWWLAAFCGWLFAFYNIERFHEPINLASFVYALAAATALPVMLFGRLHRTPFVGLFAAAIPLVLLLKVGFGYPLAGTHLPLTVTELVAVGITVFLARKIGRCLDEFHEAVDHATSNGLADRSLPFEHGQAEMYREIRRARRFHRPLTLLTISADEETIQMSLDQWISDMQRMTARNYGMARVAELLVSVLKDCDVITSRGVLCLGVVIAAVGGAVGLLDLAAVRETA